MESEVLLNAGRLRRLFTEVDLELTSETSVLIGGGAALALLWGARGTYDVDVVSDDMTPELRVAVATVGAREGIAEDWLNDGAKGFAPHISVDPQLVYRGRNLRVFSADARYLLAMKLIAAREEDIGDITTLMEKTGMFTIEDLLRLVARAYPYRQIPVAVQYMAEEAVLRHQKKGGFPSTEADSPSQ